MSDQTPQALSPRPTPVEEVANAVLASARYAALDPALVAQIATQELGKGRRRKEAIKAVKTRLHQSVGAYWDGLADYAAWRAALVAAPDATARDSVLQAILRNHHSMRERLPFLADFYRTLFAGLGPIRCVLDLGCGLNPLALPWMQLPAVAHYLACDVDREQMDFLAWWLAHYGQPGRAFVWNLLDGAPGIDAMNPDAGVQRRKDPSGGSGEGMNASSDSLYAPLHPGGPAPEPHTVDVALLLKLAPCLEQLARGIVQRLLEELSARVLIVSFPAQSLGGQRKGMVENYSAQMETWLAGRPWAVERFEFPSELVYRIQRKMQ